MTARLGNATLTEVAHECYNRAKANGWHDNDPEADPDWINTKLLLVVSELCEAQDELRNGHPIDEVYFSEGGKPEGFPVEMADAAIRIFDLLGALGLIAGFADTAELKLDANDRRGVRHGGKSF